MVDDQTTERYLDEGRSPRVVSTYENFPENVAASVCKTQKSSQKRKMSINLSDKEEQEKVLLLKSIKEKMETRAKKKEMDAEDRFVASIADELRDLPHRERLLAKNEIKNILFRYQMQDLETESNSNNNNNANNLFSLLQQGHQMVHLPGAFDTTRVNILQNQQQQNLFNNTYKSPESTMFSSPAPSPSFPPASYGKD